ncbi:Tfp pilus assembly protein FimT/FimU [Alienimonas sp. DA493]|uniref:Tfp pilus assembly protein FimT/FimU n=1 Tax=Alienimonas sp. DA493 TaxID=3373605 RepID=UPI00375498CC
MRDDAAPRRGATLLELVAAVTLMGIFAAVAASRSDGFFADATVRTHAGTVAGLLHAAKRRAIMTGTDSGLRFVKSGGRITAVVPVEQSGAALIDTDAPIPTPGGIDVTCAQSELLFDFEGHASTPGASIDFVGEDRRWRIDLTPASSSIRVAAAP